MVASSHTLLGLLCLGLRLQRAAATCYYPDGTTANDTPCSDDDEVSACCGTGYACYGSSAQFYLCQATGDELQKSGATAFVRGSCTDETWRSSKCPSVCVDEDRDNVSGGNGVGQCPDSDSEFYCVSTGLGEDNCTSGYDIIDFIGTLTALTTIGVAESTSSSASSSTSSSTTTTSSSSTLASSTLTTSTTTGSLAATATSTTSPSSDSGSSSNKTAIGAGVGVGVGGFIIVAALAFWFIRRRSQKRVDAEAAASAAGFAAGSGGGSPPNMDKAPTGYAPTPDMGSPVGTLGTLVPPTSTSPYPPSELYDSPTPVGYKASQPQHVSEMPNTQPQRISEMPSTQAETRYEMA